MKAGLETPLVRFLGVRHDKKYDMQVKKIYYAPRPI